MDSLRLGRTAGGLRKPGDFSVSDSPARRRGKLSLLNDEHMAHYRLAPGLTSSGAALLDHPAPAYPPATLANCPAQVELRALLIVGEDGAVDGVRVDPAPAISPAFAAAVRAAAMRWRFEPLVISHSPANANDESHPMDTEAKPFSLPYAFRFACHAGKAEVSSSSASHN